MWEIRQEEKRGDYRGGYLTLNGAAATGVCPSDPDWGGLVLADSSHHAEN
jgi:hypothetical protein